MSAPVFTMEGKHGKYFILRDGEKITGQICTREIAEETLERNKKKAQSRIRDCITCRSSFVSEGPHNRMCDRCRKRSQDIGLDDFPVSTGGHV